MADDSVLRILDWLGRAQIIGHLEGSIQTSEKNMTPIGHGFQDVEVRIGQLEFQSRSSATRSRNKNKGIMEHRVVQNIRTSDGDKSKFRQRHYNFMNAMYQVNPDYGRMVKVKETEMDKCWENDEVIDKPESDFAES